MRTLKLFNAVVAKKSPKSARVIVDDGYVIEPEAAWAKDEIQSFYRREALNGNDLNKTFHKSWSVIKNSTRGELAIQQIRHYISTYGTGFTGDIYIPEELLTVPGTKVVFKTIRAYTKAELTAKALGMLQSGMALKTETILDLVVLLVEDLGYKFTGKEGIKNNEAVVRIADLYGVLPDDFMGFFRYILFRATGETLVIKNGKTIAAIKASTFNPHLHFVKFGLGRLAENFNRFKPLFLAFKGKCPDTINRISKLSKSEHKPMVQNPLNLVTQRELTKADTHWLDNATPYAIFKALSALHQRENGQTVFMYKVRNGKSYVKEGAGSTTMADRNYKFLVKYLKGRIKLAGTKVYIPKDIVYSLPTSEKMYVGNIPMGTKFYGDKLAVGIYWKDSWGARDIDLSGMSAEGKTGWNAEYGRGACGSGLMYSGDITSAPGGAVEYLYAQKGCPGPTLVYANIFNGQDDSTFKIIVGRGDNIDREFMMNPNNLFAESKVQAVQTQAIIGLLVPDGKRMCFVMLNLGAGHTRVAFGGERSALARQAVLQEWRSQVSLNDLVEVLGAELVDSPEKANLDLSLDKLEKDTFVKLFDGAKKKK